MTRQRNYNHNRYLGFEKIRSQSEYEYEKSQPTFKQKSFFKSLIMKCKEHDVASDTGRTQSRAEYAMAIDKLIEQLNVAGIAVKGNGKEVAIVLHHKLDVRNNEYLTTERLVIKDNN